MRYFTLNEARTSGRLEKGHQTASNKLQEYVNSYSAYKAYDIFLSHSFSDAELILGVKKLLESQGHSVYVDWVEDPHIDRKNVTKQVAEHIRGRMKSCRSLIYATSDNASNSKWMPWELGFFDGYKPGQVFVMPVLERENDNFDGREYLSLYPVLGKNEPISYGSSSQGLMFNDGTTRKVFRVA